MILSCTCPSYCGNPSQLPVVLGPQMFRVSRFTFQVIHPRSQSEPDRQTTALNFNRRTRAGALRNCATETA